jgi:AraC-like DNA-binding protein
MLQQEALQNRSHHRHVLIMNLETEGIVHVDHLDMTLKPGQAFLILPFQFHHFSLPASSRLKWLFCTFELEPHSFLEPLRNKVINTDCTIMQACTGLLQQWHRSASDIQAQQLQAGLLFLLLKLKQARLQDYNDLPDEAEASLIRTVNRLMAEQRGRMVTVADLAAETGYSASRLRVLFREASGIPLGSYIQNYRINRSMALLRTSALSIAAVAEEAGFGSPQAFSRIFRKKTGQTPRAYRHRPGNEKL